jgi:hypothetical protein
MERTEFGAKRTNCACNTCQINCRFMPGFLIPSDLFHIIPGDRDIYEYARENLRASPGAIVKRGSQILRAGTLVPAAKPDGSCIHFTAAGACAIHDKAPFGCAFFDCQPEPPGIAHKAIQAVMLDHEVHGLYTRVWQHLRSRGLTAPGPEVLREKMRTEMGRNLS